MTPTSSYQCQEYHFSQPSPQSPAQVIRMLDTIKPVNKTQAIMFMHTTNRIFLQVFYQDTSL